MNEPEYQVAPKDFLAWITRQRKLVTETGPIQRFELWHRVQGSQGSLLETWRLDQDTEQSVEEIAGEIWTTAQNDSSGQLAATPNQYVVLAFAKNATRHDSMHMLVVKCGTRLWDTDGTEPATPSGEKAQHMRHLENMHRLTMQMVEPQISQLRRAVDELSKENRDLRKQEVENIGTWRSVMEEKHERELAVIRELGKAKRNDELWQTVLGLAQVAALYLPGVGQHMMKATGKAQANSPLAESVMRLIENLSEDEIGAIMGGLKPTNLAHFMTTYQAAQEMRKSLDDTKTPGLRRDGPDQLGGGPSSGSSSD